MKARSLAAVLALAALPLAQGCVIHHVRLRPDYDTTDKLAVKRLAVVTQPLPEGVQAAGDLWSLIGRREVNLKRQFIARETAAVAEPFEPRSRCGEGIEGVLWLKPDVRRDGGSLAVRAEATLFRCTDGGVVWEAAGGGCWPMKDEGVKEITASYTSELGPDVEPYVGPTYHLLKALVDQMPDPVLSEEDKDEKIELGD